MIRVFAIVAVLAAFGGALYFSGDYLQTWESPEPPASATPAPRSKKKKPKAKQAHPARKAKRASKPKNAWLAELNALCIRSQDEADMTEPPSSPEEVPGYIRRFERKNARLNRQAAKLIQQSGDAKSTTALRGLFDQEEQLLHSVLVAAQSADEQQMRAGMRSLLTVAKAENRQLTRLGAVDCTLPPDAFELY